MTSKARAAVTGDHPFAGWTAWKDEPFDEKAGPFFHRTDESGRLVAAFRADPSHLNAIGVVHGGCLVSLADYAMFTLAIYRHDAGELVTVSLNSEFVGGAREGDLVIAYPEIVRSGRRIVFMRGVVMAGERSVLSFSGVMMRMDGKGKENKGDESVRKDSTRNDGPA